MSMTGASSTSQPWRDFTNPDRIRRSSYESEQWDDLANVVYHVADDGDTQIESTVVQYATLVVPCPVATRIQITTSATIALPAVAGSFGRIHTNLDTGSTIFTPVLDCIPFADLLGNAIAARVSSNGAVDVEAGVHALFITGESSAAAGTYTFARFSVDVRRGRKPPE